ncbi:MAG: DNA-directed RNA polymerase subunit delta [Ectobacillus sp.]
MNLEQYSPEELKELSMIELAYLKLAEKKQATPFQEIVQEIAQTLGLSQEEVATRIAQFYTDLNIDGRFISVGENRWGLRSWYPYEQMEEEILPQVKPKKKRKLDDEELDDYVDEADDFEELDELDELDDLDEDFTEDDVEDFDDELLEDDLEEVDDDEDFIDEDEAEYDEVEEEDEL